MKIIYTRIKLLGFDLAYEEEICAHTKKTVIKTEETISETCLNGQV